MGSNKEEADQLKAQGNEQLKAGNLAKAIELYSDAIALDPTNKAYFSNRSAAYAHTKDYSSALVDGMKCTELDPNWAKGYSRKGAALEGLERWEEAKQTYADGLAKCPGDAGLAASAERVVAAASRASSNSNPMTQLAAKFAAPETLAKLATNPSTAAYMKDPSFVQMLGTIAQQPQMLTMFMQSDPRIQAALGVVLGLNMDGAPGDAPMDTDTNTAPAPSEPRPAEPAPAPEPEPMELSEEDQKKQDALDEKALGTKAYKAKDFDGAITHYQKAAEIDPTNMVFHLNIAAVHLQTKNFDACIASCDKAVEVGREVYADFKLIAKAFGRKAKAYQQQDKLTEATEWYDKALSEHRHKDYLNPKNDIKVLLKKREKEAYIDPAKSQEAKDRGNDFFKNQKFPQAIAEYTEAIKRNPSDGKLFSNRAFAYAKLAEFPHALKDAEECIKLEPTFIKGYLRKATALTAMKRYQEALDAYDEAKKIDANHPEIAKGITEVTRKKYGGSVEERQAAAMKDPEIQRIMQDPVMNQILQQSSQDPAALKQHLQNPEIREKFQKLVDAGIVQMK